MISKEDYVAFKQHPVYQESQGVVYETVEAAASELVNKTTPDVNREQYLRGFIRGMLTVLEWEPSTFAEDQGETIDNEEIEE
jgi:hypothetical protein